ncbi:MAG: hypothetical protein Q7T93_17320 [Methylobacterium sp.]|uniref:hypothetical protein n=1 Tax=unclassified Methylobacterium TaxID=2615210 RepID=UPI0006FE9456|nr:MULTISPECIES: hypothetical protein [unclassified Methylobacterium]KQP11205.1 hypothetical protein ASF28_09180 [Methylobacterium sp. Leaf99]MDO9428577.1 hypothetical protein [Methylobacterium sp.]
MTKTRIAALATALVLGVASLSPAMAQERKGRYTGFLPHEVETTGTVTAPSRIPAYGGCPMSSAAEGNADQQSRPVMQYGQTAGGNRC